MERRPSAEHQRRVGQRIDAGITVAHFLGFGAAKHGRFISTSRGKLHDCSIHREAGEAFDLEGDVAPALAVTVRGVSPANDDPLAAPGQDIPEMPL